MSYSIVVSARRIWSREFILEQGRLAWGIRTLADGAGCLDYTGSWWIRYGDMTEIRIQSVSDPFDDQQSARLGVQVLTRAEAMGILGGGAIRRLGCGSLVGRSGADSTGERRTAACSPDPGKCWRSRGIRAAARATWRCARGVSGAGVGGTEARPAARSRVAREAAPDLPCEPPALPVRRAGFPRRGGSPAALPGFGPPATSRVRTTISVCGVGSTGREHCWTGAPRRSCWRRSGSPRIPSRAACATWPTLSSGHL